MKKVLKIAVWTLGAVWSLTGCSEKPELDLAQPGEGQVTFLLGLGNEAVDSVASGAATRAVGMRQGDDAEVEQIGRMWYFIADSQGERIDLHTHKVSSDFSTLTIEGLKTGDYTVSFLAVPASAVSSTVATDGQNPVVNEAPDRLVEAWLQNPAEAEPLDGVYFAKRMELRIGSDQAPVSQAVVLDRCVGRVDVDLNLTSEYMWRFIRRIEVEFDRTDAVYTVFNADGTYDGAGGVRAYDVTESRSFYSLPSRESLSGFVEVESERTDGTPFVRRYRFSGCRIEAGRVSHISIEYLHPESNEGLLHVREQDFPMFGADTMFLADEPQSVFYDRSIRTFYPYQPLQVSVGDDHRMLMRFFSPVAIRDVKIMCRFNKFSPEFVELARFDVIYPFMEASFPLPIVSAERTFTTASGRKFVIPAQPNLKGEDVTLVIQTDDPFMKKIEQIDNRWYICFSAHSANAANPGYWRNMTPLLCRHGVALTLNMAFMFASEEFNTELEKYEGLLVDDSKNPIDLDFLRQRLRTHP
ncbi:MAG: hypothetical protein K2G93_01450, partial [Rikenella sp.]|nr:hypothetical protein [Rikenella sp.]